MTEEEKNFFREITKNLEKVITKQNQVSVSAKGADTMKFKGKSISLRPDGRWWTRYYDNNGNQKSIYGKTQNECLNNLKIALKCKTKDKNNKASKIIYMHDWLDYWYKNFKSINITSKTPEINIRLHIKPNLPNKNIKNIDYIDIQNMITKLPTNNLKSECYKF